MNIRKDRKIKIGLNETSRYNVIGIGIITIFCISQFSTNAHAFITHLLFKSIFNVLNLLRKYGIVTG